MELKKVTIVFTVIILISILAINTHFTLKNKIQISGAAAASDLPPPPGIPSFEQPTQSDDLQAEVNSLKLQVNQLTTLSQRITGLETELLDMKRTVDRIEGRPIYEQPAGEGKTSFFGTFIDIILLLGLGCLIGFMIYTKKKQENETIDTIKEYMQPYLKQGYTAQQMMPLLKQAGYSQEEIKKAIEPKK